MKFRIVEGLFICTIYTIIMKVAQFLFDKFAFWGDVILVIGWIIILLFVLLKNRRRFLAFAITGKFLSIFHINNPDYFPELNETTLKKHIKKKISNTPFNEIIHKISLYESNVDGFKYQLIVEAPKRDTAFSNIDQNWDTENPFNDDFSEIYKSKPDDNYTRKWTCAVVDIDTELSHQLVVKDHRWILYKK